MGPRCADKTLGRPRLRKCRGSMCTPKTVAPQGQVTAGSHGGTPEPGSAGPRHGGQSRQAPGSVRHVSSYSFHPADRELRCRCHEVGAQGFRRGGSPSWICSCVGPSSWRSPPSDIPGAQTAPAGSACRLSGVPAPLCPRTLRKLPPRLSREMGDGWDRSPIPLSPGHIRSCGSQCES